MKDTPILKLLMKLAPPVMVALLIQSIYNIVDSYFIASFSESGLTALSVIFPIQLFMTALATGIGNGMNILISRLDGCKIKNQQKNIMKSGLILSIVNYVGITCLAICFLKQYMAISSLQIEVRQKGYIYGIIIISGSLGMFFEAISTKILQARGNMKRTMLAQVTGAVINILLDPLLIFGIGVFPMLGVAGAAIATLIGQWIAMFIVIVPAMKEGLFEGKFKLKDVKSIIDTAIPSIVMQSLYTIYIIGLNLILKSFSEDAVTVLGIYYKLQTFFFIPIMGMGQVMLPMVSYNYGAGETVRVRQVFWYCMSIAVGFMLVGNLVFMAFPENLIRIFSKNENLIFIGRTALRIISCSFVPASAVMTMTVLFQGVNEGKSSLVLTILRQVVLLVPLAWIFHFIDLSVVWATFPVTEVCTLLVGICIMKRKKLLER